jgi:N-acyl-D-amino-acid deacylase
VHDLVIRDADIADGTGRTRFSGDVAVDDGVITAVGPVEGSGRVEVDAGGRLLAPGWVDVHTHYDGQVTWDPEVTPSSWHGVTTLVMGNCGVGFAPVRPGAEDFLIELMEGVEDIPGTALHEGLDWRWESFAQYLDALESHPRVLDVLAQVPHAAVRAYVMGERAHDDATPQDVEEMGRVVAEAVAAGAAGFSTSRTFLHSSRHGLVPGTTAPESELLALADGVAAGGGAVFQLIADNVAGEQGQALVAELARRCGGPVTYSLAQAPPDLTAYRTALAEADRMAASGLNVVPQVADRPTGMLFGLQSSLHPFITHPSYRAVADLALAERVARLADPALRERLLAEEPTTNSPVARMLISRWDAIFPLGSPPDYEPAPDTSVSATAAREGRRPEEVVLDWLLEDGGRALLFAPLANYFDGSHDAILEMMTHPRSVLGLGDGGAHCGLICDASMTTYVLTHWARDRSRGERLGVEEAVALQTSRPAALYGLSDRGTIAAGKRADLNLVDLDALQLHVPEMVFDLPAGGRRLVQRVDGYAATWVAGMQTFASGEPTGARPGGLVRGSRPR